MLVVLQKISMSILCTGISLYHQVMSTCYLQNYLYEI